MYMILNIMQGASDFNLRRVFFQVMLLVFNALNVLTIFLLEWTAPTDEVNAY